MKSASPALIAFLNAARAAPDSTIAFADCFTFALAAGPALYVANVDYPVTWNGHTFSASGPLVQGLKYKCAVGLEVDRQQLKIAARPLDLVSGVAFLQLIRDGALDGATVQRDRVFLSAPLPDGAVVDGVTLFHGRVSTVDSVGRTSAQITVASDLVVLDYDMPRNLYSPTCLHTLYDPGCGLNAAAYATSGTAGADSTATTILSSVASAAHVQGKLMFSTGAAADVGATVKSVVAGVSLTLMYPLPAAPTAGDSFAVYFGCDHTPATCAARFANLARFRGFPYVPPPQIAY